MSFNLASYHGPWAAARLLAPAALVAALHAFVLSPLARGQAPALQAANDIAVAAEAPPTAAASASPAVLPPPSEGIPPVAETPKTSLVEALNRPGDVAFRNMTMEAALFTLGETWKVNIVTGKEIEGMVNGVFKQAPLREILDAILLANGYSYRAVGDSLVVQASADVGSANPLFRSVTIPIQYNKLEEIVTGAELLKSTTGQIKPFPSARSVMVVDYADRVETISAFIARMEAIAAESAGASGALASSRLDVAYFHTHYIPALSAQAPLLAVLSPLGRVAVMERENRLLVVDYAANLEMVRKVLERVDRPRPQVRITALIYDLSLEDAEQLGVNWGSAAKGNTVNADGIANQALEFETTTLAPFAAGEAGGAFTVRSLTQNFDINSVVELLQTANDARLLANPNITVMDNELAEFESVSEIPYQQITQSELGGQIGTTAFKKAGVILRVQPTIAGDGTIEMLVEPEFSRLAGFTPQEDQPILDTRKATTRVRIASGQTIVLSGMRQRSDTGEFNGIPFLKDVKLIGPLFRSRDTNVRESELVVFIMPEITGVEDVADGRDYQALETVNCRLDAIPYAEGCLGPGGSPCEPSELMPLPAIEEGAPPMETDAGGPSPSSSPVPPALRSEAPMRPAYEARFRADGATDLRDDPDASADAAGKGKSAKPTLRERMFGS